MLQQTAQQATRIRKEKSIATKEFPIATEIVKDSKKSCRDRENFIAIELTGRKVNVCCDKLQKGKDIRSWVNTGLLSRHKAFLSRQEQDC